MVDKHVSWVTPITESLEEAFTETLEEIEKWKTPDWDIEKAD